MSPHACVGRTPCTIAGLLLVLAGLLVSDAAAQMVAGPKIPGFAETFGVEPGQRTSPYTAKLVAGSVPANILWPEDQPSFTIQIVSNLDEPLHVKGKIDVVAYGTRGRPGDIWKPDMFKIADVGSVPIDVALGPKGFVDVTVRPAIPAKFGAYGIVADLGPHGRQFVTSCVRTFAATPGRVQYPKFCLDAISVDVLKRLGVKAVRQNVPYKPTTDKDFADWFDRQAAMLKEYSDADIAVLFMVGGGAYTGDTQPLGRPRPWLDEGGVMLETKFDLAWVPKYDADFRQWCTKFAAAFGWPKGSVNAFSLWNEPWEGISISGWGADMLRYREIFTAMCLGVEDARKDAGVEVLLGGGDSTSNALDKFFADGSDEFLKWFDFCSIHYQGLAPHSTIKSWVDRKGPRGRVRVWDTESWVANTDDRVAAVVAADRAAGYDRAMGVFHGNIAAEQTYNVRTADGKPRRVKTCTAWPVAASIGAVQHFIGERDFKGLLFTNGLPWVMLMDGLPGKDGKPDPDDGTVVVVGDLGEEFGAANVAFRTARGLAEVAHKAELRKQLAALPADAPATDREALQAQMAKFEVLSGATMTLSAAGGRFSLYDFYGNAVAPKDGRIVVPLDGRGFFLRADGSPGSLAELVKAVRESRIEGIEPLATVAHDMTARIEQGPALRLTLTNVLNRPVSGTLTVRLGGLKVEPASQPLVFAPNETKEVVLKASGAAVASNTYPLDLTFDAGADGTAVHQEDLHVNVIARRTIKVDGNLEDWKGVLPQPVTSGDAGPTLTEAAWFPFSKFDASVTKGFATGYLAYDKDCFYFAAKIADDTPDEGTCRFETRNDDEYFYPETSYGVDRDKSAGKKAAPPQAAEKTPLKWPEGVRRYSYRKRPELPAGNAPNHDNVQIAFNVLAPQEKPWRPFPPGTMPGFVTYKDTDYEYALNQVAPKYGGGVEIWRLEVPGMPHKHFYPRQPKSPKDGPVKDGQLKFVRDGNTLVVEAAIPWSEIPDVKRRLDEGKPIKFSYRVNDNAGKGCMELSRLRSVARRNGSFHVDWVEHWANELEFALEK